MTTTLLAGALSVASLCAPSRGQDAPPPVPPPVGQDTPIPPPPAEGLTPPVAPAPEPTTTATTPKPQATPVPATPASQPVAVPVAPAPEVAPAPAVTPGEKPELPPPASSEKPNAEAFPPPPPVAEAPATAPAAITEPVVVVPTTGPAPAPAASQPAGPAVAAKPAEADPVNPALAERLTSMATGLLRSQQPSNAVWRYATALLQASVRLAPNEPRYQRFLIEAAGNAGDKELVLKTLESYRKIAPEDQWAQTQLIDAYLERMQAADARVDYLKKIVESAQIPAPVRSFAAMRLAAGYMDRMQDQEAAQAVMAALQLNFLNLDALRIRAQNAQQPGQPAERLAALLAMLQSNPAQPPVVVGVARELADVGLVQRSLEWFKQSLELQARMGQTPSGDVAVDYACELFISGEGRAAAAIADQATKLNPDDLNAWLLKLTLARSAENKELLATSMRQAQNALVNRLATIRQQAGDKAATTRPIDAEGEPPPIDPEADLKFIAENKPELAGAYATVASGMAWLKIYFAEQPAQAAPFVKAVASVMGESNELVARLQGWSFLVAGNTADATAKLSAVADKDPVAALGMIRMAKPDAAGQAASTNEIRKLLQGAPSRLTGACIMEGLGKRALKVTPTPAAGDVEKVLADFPKDWMKILDQPQLYYSLRVDPVAGRVSVPVGEPMLVQISVANVSEYPLTMGPEGIIHPDIWLHAQTRGVQQQFYPNEAFARLAGPIVLAPKQSITQIVRLDQAQLLSTLERFPTANFNVGAIAMTNPTTIRGQVDHGPAGMQVQIAKMMERRGAPIGQQEVAQKLFTAVQTGESAEKIRAAETLIKFATLLTGEGAGDQVKQIGFQCADAVRVTSNDNDPTVRAWATYLYSVYSGDQQLLGRLVHDPSWVARTLGIVATDYTGQSKDVFKDLVTSDPEPVVKQLAAAASEVQLVRRGGGPTSQPAAATQPITSTSDAAPAVSPPMPTPAPAVTPPTPVPAAATNPPVAPASTQP
jgi:tetratricopeptide (TPR) repeat protein